MDAGAEEALLPRQSEPAASPSGDDERLVRECLNGNQEAWTALIEKYERLIFAIALKYGTSHDDAADILQAVCLELFSELQNLRKVESLRSWLITVTIRKSYRWRRQQETGQVEIDAMDSDATGIPELETHPPEWLEKVEREQMVREALLKLKPRCAEMIRMLFYEHPPLPYTEVARKLGLATGSIGFIRGRCLTRLQKALVEMGF